MANSSIEWAARVFWLETARLSWKFDQNFVKEEQRQGQQQQESMLTLLICLEFLYASI